MLELDHLSTLKSAPPDLKWVESALIQSRYPLPPSYLEFAREYGYGRALGLLIMQAPRSQGPDAVVAEGEKVRGFIRMAVEGGSMEYTPDGSKELAERLFPFAMSENGEYFAWRLQAPTAGAAGRLEYPIYCLAARMAGIRYAADDLDHLLRRLTSIEVKDVLGSGYSPLPMTFEALGG